MIEQMVERIESGEGVDMPKFIDDVQSQLIKSALAKCDGVVQRAAKLLGVSRPTLIYKIKILKIESSSNGC